jgi:hypothetical protein
LPGLALNCDPPISASQVAGITGMSHPAQPIDYFLFYKAYRYSCFELGLFNNVRTIKTAVTHGDVCMYAALRDGHKPLGARDGKLWFKEMCLDVKKNQQQQQQKNPKKAAMPLLINFL